MGNGARALRSKFNAIKYYFKKVLKKHLEWEDIEIGKPE